MDCIHFKQKPTVTAAPLLTHSDKIYALQKVLRSHRHSADLFLPEDNFYAAVNEPQDAERMARQIFNWLGIKHKSLIFHIDADQDQPLLFEKDHGHSHATLGLAAIKDPVFAGAVIAHAVIHHLLIGRHKLILASDDDNEVLADLGTIYAGLGILVLNGLESGSNPLGGMARNNYVSEFLDYVNNHQIVTSLWQPYVLPGIVESFVEFEQRIKPSSFVSTYYQHRQKLKRRFFATAGLSLLAVVGLSSYLYLQANATDLQLAEQDDTVQVLRTQVEHCEQTVRYKQDRWDTSDYFIQRQIEADKTRCASLKNRYQYEQNSYRTDAQP